MLNFIKDWKEKKFKDSFHIFGNFHSTHGMTSRQREYDVPVLIYLFIY